MRFPVRWPAFLGWCLLVGYVTWNLFWLSSGRVPPSIFKAITGLPAPTTGGTRAMRSLREGALSESLRYNPFAVPITLLFVATIAAVAVSAVRGRGLRISGQWAVAWAVLLLVAWIWKLTGDPQYW